MDAVDSLCFTNVKTDLGGLDPAVLQWLVDKFSLKAFVETGTYRGDSVAAAASIFEQVHSIELSQKLYEEATSRFRDQKHIHLHRGDSGIVLRSVLHRIEGRPLLWLDAHFSEGETARGEQNTPVLAELDALEGVGRNDVIIVIDDIRLFQASQTTLPSGSSVSGYPTLSDVYARLLSIEPGYQFFVVGDVALALPPDVTCQVSPVVQSCTLSRLYAENLLPVEDLLHAESVIATAQGEERKFLEELPTRFVASEPYGLCNYFHLWQGLVLNASGQYSEASDAFYKAVGQGLTHWRVHWYLAQAAQKAGDMDLAHRAALQAEQGIPESYRTVTQDDSAPPPDTKMGGEWLHGDLKTLRAAGLWREGNPIKLHLGCGERYLDGYINVDYPPGQHNVMHVRPDLSVDFTQLDFPRSCIDEIRHHHVFEHFGRVAALSLLIKWHRWLKIGGQLHIETPDIEGSAVLLASGASSRLKMAALRHLAGDQSAPWAYHLDLWSGERLVRTLGAMGFHPVLTRNWKWPHDPHLANVQALGTKAREMSDAELVAAAEGLLTESMVSSGEKPLLDVWKSQLKEALSGNLPGPAQRINGPAVAAQPLPVLPDWAETSLCLEDLYDANQRNRDAWMAARATGITSGSRVLDVGAGTCPYRRLFTHCDYRTHDFKKYEGTKLGGGTEYGAIDYVSDIATIPVPDESFDVVICTEVLEHVAEPIEALREMTRVLKPNGRMLITAPLGSGLHQLPHHYYGGYTPEWYRHFGKQIGLDIREIVPNGGFFGLLAQECARVSWTLPQHAYLHGDNLPFVRALFGEWLPRFLYGLDKQCINDQFTIGYHVDAVKAETRQCEKQAAEEFTCKETARDEGGSNVSNLYTQPTHRLAGIVFSKDRPLQLDATLRSFFKHGEDAAMCNLAVLYSASSSETASIYEQIAAEFRTIEFIRESAFRQDVLERIQQATHVLFIVDDTIFVRHFSLGNVIRSLDRYPEALGFSMRLGCNTVYCYSLDKAQALPDFIDVGEGVQCFNWTDAEYDFGYPLEVSSSVYRAEDIKLLLSELEFYNPNTLEAVMSDSTPRYRHARAYLFCFTQSVAFSAPVNKVQTVCDNRAGSDSTHSSQELISRYKAGDRIDIEYFSNFVPRGCHEEVEFRFKSASVREPLVTVVIPCYGQSEFLPDAVNSVVRQTVTDWECVIVDDGSPDNTADVAENLIRHHESCKIRLVSKPNGGLSSARNAGVREARGRYILPLDSDDMLHPEFLAETVAVLEAQGDYGIVYVDEQNFGDFRHIHCKGKSSLEILLQANVHDYCSLYRREVWESVGGYSPAMYLGGEDWNFWVSAAAHGFRSWHIAKPLFLYRNRQNTMMSETLANLDEVRAHIVLHHPDLFTRREVLDAEKRIAVIPATNREKLARVLKKNPDVELLRRFAELSVGGMAPGQPGRKAPSSGYPDTAISPLETLPAKAMSPAELTNFGTEELHQAAAISHTIGEPPLVSVVMPTKDRRDHIPYALRSLAAQDYRRWELVLVNDGGEDIADLVEQYLSDREVRYVSLPQSVGQVAARNSALKAAHGEIICYLDDDDRFLPNHLSTVVAAIRQQQCGFVYTDAEYVAQAMLNGSYREISRSNPYGHGSFSLERLLIQNYIPINSWAHRRDCLWETGLFEEALPCLEDWEFLLRMAARYGCHHIPVTTVEVYTRADAQDNVSDRNRRLFLPTFLEIYKRHGDAGDATVHAGRDEMLRSLAHEAVAAGVIEGQPEDVYRVVISELYGKTPQEISPVADSRRDLDVEDTQDYRYPQWVERHQLQDADLQLLAERVHATGENLPAIQLITIVEPACEGLLADTIDSLQHQFYRGWGLSVIASTPAPDSGLDQHEMLEWVHVRHEDYLETVNRITRESTAEWIAIIDGGDSLESQALLCSVAYIQENPHWRFIYCDEDTIDARGSRFKPRFKPDLNLDMLRSTPYTGSFCLIARDTLLTAGGITTVAGAAVWNYDMAFRVIEGCGEAALGHIPDVLFHRHVINQEKFRHPEVEGDCRSALVAHLGRCNVPARVSEGLLQSSFFVQYQHNETPLVSIIIPTKDRLDLIKPCVSSLLEKTTYPNYEVLVVDNNSSDPEVLCYLESLEVGAARVNVLRYPRKYNFSAINNFAAERANGDYLLLLNNDTLVVQPNWLERMVAHGQRPEVGIVGARLVFPDQSLQHAGVVMGLNGAADHVHLGLPITDEGYMGRAQLVQNFSAVTAACLLVRRSLYEAVGGLDEQKFKVLFNDVDLCLKVAEKGYKTVWTPYATVVHYGSSSLKQETDPRRRQENFRDTLAMFDKWLSRMAHDPAYNRNLTLVERSPQPETDIVVPWNPDFRDRPRLLGFPFDTWGCGEYRINAPLRALHRNSIAQTACVPPADFKRIPDIGELARLAPDSLFLQSFVHDYQILALEAYRKLLPDMSMVFELDDLKTDLPPKNPHSRTMYRDIRKRLRRALSYCDRMIVTTEPLAEAYSKYIDDIVIVPNTIDMTRWKNAASLRQQSSKPRVGWAGAQQHHGDLALLYDVLRDLADEVEWVFFGMCPKELKPYVNEFHEGVTFENYPSKLASLNLDLALAPLEHNKFNEAKSNLRLLEYGTLGWPVIATDIFPYQPAPVTRVANNTRAWSTAIREHIDDPDASFASGDRLRQWVVENWLLEDHLEGWFHALTPGRHKASDGGDLRQTGTG